MFMIAGLGNPGKEYDRTRHNAGFSVIDVLAGQYGIEVRERKHRALCGKGIIEGEKVILIKPQTFMNLSGESIRPAMNFYKLEAHEIIVIYDDISLAPGQLRIRQKGSAGGHNGIKNIIAHLGTQEFSRIKVGVGAKPEEMDLAAYVTSRFSQGEQKLMEEAFRDAAAAAVAMMTEGTERAMNMFNKRKTDNQE